MKFLAYALSVLAIIVVMVAVIVSVFMVDAARAEEPRHGWQLGICVDDPVVLRRCRLVGGPMPDEQLCKALRDSLKSKINAGRVHCTRVLIDAEYDA